MKKLLAVTIVFLFFCMIIFPSSGIQIQNKTIITSNRGNTLYVGSNGSGNYSTIQDAIDDASDGDTVFVYDDSSPYYENLIVDKSINLIGENRDTTIIDGNWSGNVINITANYTKITGFTITKCEDSTLSAGIYIFSDHNHITVANNNISYNGGKGIVVEGSSFITIQNNIIKNNLGGIVLRYECEYNVIQNNTITTTQSYPYGCDGVSLYESSSYNSIIGNEITSYKCTLGINLDSNCNNNIIGKNCITPQVYGSIGIQIWDSDFNVFFENVIGFFYAHVVSSFGQVNKFYHNNFIDNYHPSSAWDIWDNGYPSGGNYWSDYSGVDNYSGPGQNISGSDGIGDTPYNISGYGDQDRYPLMLPYVDQGAPNRPLIEGNTSGKVGNKYNYTFITIDPDGDDVYYYIDWGDNTNSGWIGYYSPYSSGVAVIKAHKWNNQGTYTIKAKAKTIGGEESEWSNFTVKMPRDKTISSSLFLRFFERFQLIQYLFQRFGLK